MMSAQTVSQKHMRSIQQNLLRLELTSTTLNFQLFTHKTTSFSYSASLSYQKLQPPFSSIFSNLQELYKQFKEINQSHLSFDSEKCELKYLIQTSTKICQMRISMQKMSLDRFQQLQVQNLRLLKRQELMCQIIQQKNRQLQQYKLTDSKTPKLQKQVESIVSLSQQNDNSSQPIVKKEEECSNSPSQVQSKSHIQKCLNNIKKQYPSCEVNQIISRLQLIIDRSFSLKSDTQDEGESSSSKIQEVDQFLQDNRLIPITQILIDQKKVAKFFIREGFGFKMFKESIKDGSITSSKYNKCITSIMKNTLKTIQSAAKMISEPIFFVALHQQSLIRSQLRNCRSWLPQEELQTFHNFIRIIYGLGEVKISALSTRRLYKQIIKYLKFGQTQDQFQKVKETGEEKLFTEKSQMPSIKRRRFFNR